jgi:hypothetical protein
MPPQEPRPRVIVRVNTTVHTVIIVRPVKVVKVVAHTMKCETPQDKKLTLHCACVTAAAIITIILLRIAGDFAGAFGPMIGGVAQEIIDWKVKIPY